MIPKLDAEFQRRVHLGDDFSCDAYVFRRAVHDGQYQEVRILHAGRILSAAWPQMLDVWRYMNSEGFRQAALSAGNRHVEIQFCPDIALIGCLSRDMGDVGDIISELERNHGLFREWDILVYFIDDKVPRKVFEILGRGSVVSRYEFADDARRLLHAHLRRRYDVISRRGVYTTMEHLLGESLDRITEPDPDRDTLGKKVRRVEGALKKHSSNDDVDTVIKYIELLLRMRNWNAHPKEEYAFKKRKEAWESVRDEAKRRQYVMVRDHDPNRPKPKTVDAQDFHDMVKNTLILTYKIKDWLDRYAAATGEP